MRRLAAILVADVVGYSRLMRSDESATLSGLKEVRRKVIDPALAARGGRIVKSTGDGLLVEFASALEATKAALDFQTNLSLNPSDAHLTFRVGIHVGDIVSDEGDIFGDGVNVAARIETQADTGSICVSDAVYEQVRDHLDPVFVDLGERHLKNIDRPVRVWQWSPLNASQAVLQEALSYAVNQSLPKRPSIAVLPFRNLSGDPDQEFFSDGITDDIISDLSRYKELFVIAQHSSFAYRNSTKTRAEIAKELGVQYIAEGSVQRAANRIRITVRLIDPGSATDVWSERYNREATDIFSLQDEITEVVVNRLAGQIERRHRQRAMTSSESLGAYDFVLKAQHEIFLVGRDNARSAFENAMKALELEPKNARALSFIGWYYITEASNSWGMDPDLAYSKAWDAALEALHADEDEPFAMVVLAWVYKWRDGLHDRALAELNKVCELYPSNASYRSYLAFAQIYSGDHVNGMLNLEHAMRLNPHFPVLYDNHYMRALFHLKRSSKALQHAVKVRTHMPQASNALALTAAIFASLDMRSEAAQVISQIREISPGYTRGFVQSRLPYRLDEDKEYFLEMLEKAGLPE